MAKAQVRLVIEGLSEDNGLVRASGFTNPKTLARILCVLRCVPFIFASELLADVSSQQVEIENGVRIVHNKKGKEQGGNPKFSIELVRTIGDIDTDDENLAFNSPLDMAVDNAGSIFILDSRNQRIQVFDPSGRFMRTIGRRGQGPGEFASLDSIALDSQGHLHVLDDDQKRIQVFTPRGEVLKTSSSAKLMLDRLRLLSSGSIVTRGYTAFIPGVSLENAQHRLVKLLDADLNVIMEFGKPFDFGDEMTNYIGNSWQFEVDSGDHVYLCYLYQNRIEKYSPEGRLLWQADRELNFSTKPIDRGKREVTLSSARYTAPKMNRVAVGIAADSRSRVWVVTCNRQINSDEELSIVVKSSAERGTARKVVGDTDLRKTDMYKLEVFGPDGGLLSEIPLTHFVDMIYIHKDRLFLLDRDRGVKFYEYKIGEPTPPMQ